MWFLTRVLTRTQPIRRFYSNSASLVELGTLSEARPDEKYSAAQVITMILLLMFGLVFEVGIAWTLVFPV